MLFAGYTLRDDVAQGRRPDAAGGRHRTSRDDPRKVVQDFEVLKEKAPELVVPFDRDRRRRPGLPRHRRARAGLPRLAGRSPRPATSKTPRIGEALRQRGRTLEGIAFLLDLWREYPDTASIRGRPLRPLADSSPASPPGRIADATLRRELAAAGVTRPDLQLQAIRLTRSFLASRPRARRPTRRAWPWSATSWTWRTSTPSSSSPAGSPPSTPRAPTSTASSTPRPSAGSTWASTTAPSPSPRRSPGHLQGRQRRRPAQPQQVAGPLHPRPDPRRPPPARQGPGVLPARWPTASPTPPAPSRGWSASP